MLNLVRTCSIQKLVNSSSTFVSHNFTRLFSLNSQKLNNNNETTTTNKSSSNNIKLTEELPPIPPNYGYIGDENVQSIHELNRIRSSFKYGFAIFLFFFL